MFVSVTSPIVLCKYNFVFSVLFLVSVRQVNIACNVLQVQFVFSILFLV